MYIVCVFFNVMCCSYTHHRFENTKGHSGQLFRCLQSSLDRVSVVPALWNDGPP